MPRLEVEGVGEFDVEEGKRLILAIEQDAGVDILHRCGANAKCTTLPDRVPRRRAGADDAGRA